VHLYAAPRTLAVYSDLGNMAVAPRARYQL
jgi:hypothetical protein